MTICYAKLEFARVPSLNKQTITASLITCLPPIARTQTYTDVRSGSMNINSSYDDGEDDDDELLIPEIVVVPTKVKMATSAALSHAQDSNSWECEHDCGFRDKSIATVEKHELTCASNPASRPYNPIYEDEEDDSFSFIRRTKLSPIFGFQFFRTSEFPCP